MKKIITSSFVLASVLAHAQEGTVGINTMNPKATLEVQPSTVNLTGTTNEGLLIPRLSKERVAKMANPETSTLVYVNEATTYTTGTDTAADTRVAKIDAVGFYHYNGTQWVKHLDTDTNDAEWVYNPTIMGVDLKRSGEGDFKNKIFFDENGNYYNVEGGLENASFQGMETAISDNVSSVTIRDIMLKTYGAGNFKFRSSESIKENPYVRLDGEQVNNKHFSINVNKVLSLEPSVNLLIGDRSYTYIDKNDASNLSNKEIVGQMSGVYGFGTTNVKQVTGGVSNAYLANAQSASVLIGNGGYARMESTGRVGTMIGGQSRAEVGSVAQSVDAVEGARIAAAINKSSALVKNVKGLHVWATSLATNTDVTGEKFAGGIIAATNSGGTKYATQVALELNSLANGSNLPQNHYGLKIGNIIGVSSGDTYSIHTGSGKIRFGDLVGTGNRPVFADADGKLIIGDATNAATSFKWVEDATNTSVKLAVNSAGTDRTTAPVSITDTGMVKATSFQGSNGATIFSDYVFQKYYDGVSDIKADYTFKTLSQVEDFVKTNGHLPGYKSAAEIKNQGYIDLMETQLTNVEKIEELYLHSIEQDKTNKTQAEELKAKDAKIQELEARLEKLEKLLK